MQADPPELVVDPALAGPDHDSDDEYEYEYDQSETEAGFFLVLSASPADDH